jgi:hypothetical protein
MTSATNTREDVAHAVKEAAKSVEEQVRSGGEQAYASARAQAEKLAVERRDGVASYTHDLADALGSASDVLQERGRDTVARLARRAAEEIDAMGQRVEGQDVGRLVHEVEAFARQRPAVFLGAAFLLSFALVRYFGRSGGHHEAARSDMHRESPMADIEQPNPAPSPV